MARCAHSECGRWRPGLAVKLGGLGFWLNDEWYCSVRCLELAARQRLAETPPAMPATMALQKPARLGRLLARQNSLPQEVVAHALAEQETTGLRLGTQLVEFGAVTAYDVLRALATQAGVRFLMAIGLDCLATAPGNLSTNAVRSLRLVPFEADSVHQVLKVACTAPVPRTAIGALRELSGWIVEPYLVADEQWPDLARAYGSSRKEDAPASVDVPDLPAMAARVAEVAKTTKDVRVTGTRCDDCLWVRLEGAGRTEELWLSIPGTSPEGSVPPHAGAETAATARV